LKDFRRLAIVTDQSAQQHDGLRVWNKSKRGRASRDRMKYLHLLWMGLTRRKLRTLLTLISVAVAFLLFGLLEAVSSVSTEAGGAAGAAHRLITVSKFMVPLPISLAAQIPTVSGVEEVAYGSFLFGTYRDPRNTIAAVAVAHNYFDLYPDLNVTAAARRAFDATPTAAIAGAALARQYHWKVGEQIPIQSGIYPREDRSDTWTFGLVGIYHAKTSAREKGLFIRWRGLDLPRIFEKSTVFMYIEKIAHPDQAARIAARIDALSANSGHETKTLSESAFAAHLIGQLVDLALLVHAIIGAAFFTLILLTGNTMAQAVRERIPELAILKTVGFSNRRVLALVLAESVLLLVLGGIVGLFLATRVDDALEARVVARLPIAPVGAPIWLQGLALMVLIGLVVGALPAWRGMRLRVVDALAGR
jgi:putative ABC transport system permease protein